MSLSDESTDPTPITRQETPSGFEDTEPVDSMQEFYKLYKEFLVITLVLTGIIFISVWIFYSLNIALSYLLGAITGMVYVRMLAKDVERISQESRQLSKTRFALLVVITLLASRWHQLQIMPIFLGFLTYKATLIIYVIRESLLWALPNPRQP